MRLEQEFYEWLRDYVNDDEAKGLSKILFEETRKYYKYRFAVGVITGIFVTLLLLKYFS